MSMPEGVVRQDLFGSLVNKPRSRPAMAGLLLTIVAALAAVASGFGHRFGLWTYNIGFIVLLGAAILALVGVVLGLVGVHQTRPSGSRRGLRVAVAALLIGAVTAAVPLLWIWTAYRLPPIHDISTDTQNPPLFEAILPLRYRAPDPAEYGGPAVAAQQRAAYPDVQPLLTPLPPAAVFDAAVATARDLGWIVVAGDPASGRIEATDTSFWFGFVDDVVVRFTPETGGGTRVDVRSVSRVGLGDAGANARRVRDFLSGLAERLNRVKNSSGAG